MINSELNQPYLDTLKHILNFIELEPVSLSKPIRYTPTHYEADYTGDKLKLHIKAYELAVSRGVISSRSANTVIKSVDGKPDKHRFYIQVDQQVLLEELENVDSINVLLAKTQLIKAELKLEKQHLFVLIANEKHTVKENLATYRSPYKLVKYLLSNNSQKQVTIDEVNHADIDTRNMAETIRAGGLNRKLKEVFCPVCTKSEVHIIPVQSLDIATIKMIKQTTSVKRS
jgi:Zn finger protein HypA/HybF involved in hydrogenase expression